VDGQLILGTFTKRTWVDGQLILGTFDDTEEEVEYSGGWKNGNIIEREYKSGAIERSIMEPGEMANITARALTHFRMEMS
jgi:hypothetical protein